ncbi:hypothetical protein SAMN02910265_00789 [Ruminococcus flavefaciens]|uniref:Uncharacterized protein n=1 Tax=Ruminococcus flavefaciens TaxID=1265 RepID=A0A1H6IIL4_RUMFL|nr:hypothetical protein [Ruminococcus flavefaciens]SEH46163.1 hypothetical protein SAMN02910265_00789 [Ruminococcus flavefaciens]
MKNNIIGAVAALSLLASSYAALTNGTSDPTLTAKAANANLQVVENGANVVVWNGQFKLKFFGEGRRFVANGKTLVKGDDLKVYYANLDGLMHANPNYIDRENIFLVVNTRTNQKKIFFNVKNPKVYQV